MDLNALVGTLLSGDSLSNMGKISGTSQNEVQDVLASVLPLLLNGAQNQAQNKNTATGFANALQNHAKADTSNLAAFLSNVDLDDGGKILGHLLGGEQQVATQRAAKKAGLDIGKTATILAAAAPLLMSLMGQQSARKNNAARSNAVSPVGGDSLFGSADVVKLLSTLLGGR